MTWACLDCEPLLAGLYLWLSAGACLAGFAAGWLCGWMHRGAA